MSKPRMLPEPLGLRDLCGSRIFAGRLGDLGFADGEAKPQPPRHERQSRDDLTDCARHSGAGNPQILGVDDWADRAAKANDLP